MTSDDGNTSVLLLVKPLNQTASAVDWGCSFGISAEASSSDTQLKGVDVDIFLA